jgi:hypothetical protein
VPVTWGCSGPRQTPLGIPDSHLLLTSRNTVSDTDVLTACLRHDGFLSGRFRSAVKMTLTPNATACGIGTPGPLPVAGRFWAVGKLSSTSLLAADCA